MYLQKDLSNYQQTFNENLTSHMVLSRLQQTWPVDQTQSTACFCIVCGLRMVVTFLNG